MKSLQSSAILLCLFTTACAPPYVPPPAPYVDTHWGDEIIRNSKERIKLSEKALTDTEIACGAKKYGLPSDDFNREVNAHAVDEFYGCFKSSYPKYARSLGEEDRWINIAVQRFSFQESLWRQVIEKSITPGFASQEMILFDEKQKHDLMMEDQYQGY